jgi:serralysin
MCLLCAARAPNDPLAQFDLHLARVANVASAGNVYSLGQIATQLTEGFWRYSDAQPRAFALPAGQALTYDFGDLAAAERHIARAALDAWADVSALRFVPFTPLPIVQEFGDAGATVASTARMAVNQAFHGRVASASDVDAVGITLQAGVRYTIVLEGRGNAGLVDSLLQIRSATGTVLAENDDAVDNDFWSQLTFTPTTSGTYFLVAQSYGSEPGGNYRLAVSDRGLPYAQIGFTNSAPDGGAFATSDLKGRTIQRSSVNIEQGWDADPISINSYWFQTYVHEIGHALGLGHAGNYNGNAAWGRDNGYANDSWMMSVMSYFSQIDNPNLTASYAYLATVMPADILAIQTLYGQPAPIRQGDTVYGEGSNAGGYLQRLFDAAFGGQRADKRDFIGNGMAVTIFDSGGQDTLRFTRSGQDQYINLAPGAVSDVGDLAGNLTIWRGTVIEHAESGRGNDVLLGNGVANRLSGGAGNDRLRGLNGDDTLIGGFGNDTLIGGAGRDVALYGGSRALTIDLQRTDAQATGQGRDMLRGIESVVGGTKGDIISGNLAANTLWGGGGADTLIGRSGNDRLFGQAGHDRLIGGPGRDMLDGGAGNDVLTGGGGADTFVWNGGRDRITDFTDNVDTIVFSAALWGGAARSIGQILQSARVEQGDLVFRFGSENILRIDGLTRANALSDDLLIL